MTLQLLIEQIVIYHTEIFTLYTFRWPVIDCIWNKIFAELSVLFNNWQYTNVILYAVCQLAIHLWLFLLVTCPVEGQFYTTDCFGANATCSNPNPPEVCDIPQCVCPQGQVTDAVGKACINGTDCSKHT